MIVICPNCGFNHAEEGYAAELLELVFDLPLKEKDVLVRLIKSRGAKVSHDAMFDYLYGTESDGGPDCGNIAIYTHISKLRRKIERLGWTIKTKRFDGMRLIKVTP
jgi:DNA-binding response OmpR family regulator